MKKISLILGIIVIIVFGGMGYMTYKNEQEKQEMIAIATSDEVRKVYEEKIRKIDSKAFTDDGAVDSYVVDENSIEKNPMAGTNVTLLINGNSELQFRLTIYYNGDKLVSSNGVYNAKLAELLELTE